MDKEQRKTDERREDRAQKAGQDRSERRMQQDHSRQDRAERSQR